ncbi:exodeoxyribonuclease VII small subunit, partial [Salmonella enterica subsp. enterica serovar 1,4,[5],12:i:-]|nr:exodeoxyribonuclease VII small subunit [Salmonella enterica subsp. enterica serovar 1,4,[5],12:i:-]
MPKKPAQSASTEQTASFESALGELESIVTRLESGELPLEDALNEFERG